MCQWPNVAATLFGTNVAETILASVQVRAYQQAGQMNASDPIKIIKEFLQGGGRPHMENRCRRGGGGVVTSSKPLSLFSRDRDRKFALGQINSDVDLFLGVPHVFLHRKQTAPAHPRPVYRLIRQGRVGQKRHAALRWIDYLLQLFLGLCSVVAGDSPKCAR